jgi:hypothetical protein
MSGGAYVDVELRSGVFRFFRSFFHRGINSTADTSESRSRNKGVRLEVY